ncbi:MAG: nucleoside triphosphate pyrophosphohydrolase [Bacteroidales bacterium]|nr:nucleoside triphosphate pyrophosphohydrolase [Bacteroidales bacterium]
MSSGFQRLKTIMDVLRTSCEWDKAQTFESIRYLSIEEVNELSEAILALDPDDPRTVADLKKELGDLALHIMFYSKIAEEQGLFDVDDVLHAISDKLVSRHPHISLPLKEGGWSTPTADGSHPGWEQVKMREGRKSVLDGVPRTMPSLVKAVRLQEKAAGAGIKLHDDPLANALNNLQQLDSDCRKLQTPLNNDTPVSTPLQAEQDFGNILFALVQWGNSLGINADNALAKANNRFLQYVKQQESATQNSE